MHVQQEYIRCGKPRCKCTRGELHGPYWYGYWRDRGRMRSVYIGKTLPNEGRHSRAQAEEPKPRERSEAKPNAEDVPDRFAWDGRRLSVLDAMRILGIATRTRDAVTKAFRDAMRRWHPDRARTDEERARFTRISQAVNAARDLLERAC